MPVIEWLMTGVNAVLEAAILIPIISIMSVVLTMNSVQARDKAINADMRDYMAFNQYDETHVYHRILLQLFYLTEDFRL